MGNFSWLTADSKRSIWCTDSGQKVREAFLLQPNGETPISEPAYEGYGVFGGVDAYVWLAQHNIPAERLKGLSADDIRSVGISLGCGAYYVDRDTGKKYSVFHTGADIIDPEITHLPYTYAEPIPEFDGRMANDMIAEGKLVRHEFKDEFVKVPLKFSFNANAVYENLPASDECPNQGVFAPETVH